MKNILFIAYHFPPILDSSGYLRSLKFLQYLPQYGFNPTVLSVNLRAYPLHSPAQLKQVPQWLEIERSFALDAQRHLAFRGRYLGFTSLPDRFSTWIPSAILKGLQIIRRKKIDIIISTYPIPSAHVIGLALSKITKLPWVADFRDPMWDDDRGFLSLAMKMRRRIEAAALKQCSQAVVCTDGMAELFKARYDSNIMAKVSVIPNGFDEKDFQHIQKTPRGENDPVTFIHAGLLEQVDRDPIPFFKGIKIALEQQLVSRDEIRIILLGLGNNEIFREEIKRLNLEEVILLQPPLPYSQALQAMASADVLLLFQGPTCDPQTPAKFYEYLRIGKPILALTTKTGQTGQSVNATQSGKVLPWDEPETIAKCFGEWSDAIKKGNSLSLPHASGECALPFSRQNQTRILAELLATL